MKDNIKKILYSRLVKWITFIFIGCTVAVMLALTVTFVDDTIEHDNKCDIVINMYDTRHSMECDLLHIQVNVLSAYKTEGMDGVTAEVERLQQIFPEGSFNVIFTDGKKIYCDFDDISISSQYGNDMYRYVEVEFKTLYNDTYEGLMYKGTIDAMYWFRNNYWSYMYDTGEEIWSMLEDSPNNVSYRIYISNEYFNAIDERNDKAVLSELNTLSEEYGKVIEKYVLKLIACSVVLMVLSALAIVVCGRTKEGLKEMNRYDKLNMEFHSLIIIIELCAVFGMAYLVDYYCEYFHKTNFMVRNEQSVKILWIVAGTLLFLGLYYQLGVIVKKLKNKNFLKNWLVVRCVIKIYKWCKKWINRIRESIYNIYDQSKYNHMPDTKKQYVKKLFMDVVMVISTLLIFLFCMLELNYGDTEWTVMALVAYTFMMLIYFTISVKQYKHLQVYNKITKAIDTISDGEYDNVEYDPAECNETLNKLANVSVGFEESVRKQVEAEKMQIELVANVSHDLKTPLTSIISYVDLLKEEEMSDVAKDYVKVLVDKSARLKDIVADVFDLAKATSGEQVEMEQLDGVVLINQVLSDMSDKIEAANRDLRIKIADETAPITGNGQKLYRVFQNVIDNALKYSMPNTRIYLTAEKLAGDFVVTVKNISEYEMEFTAEEILSRFTRGDKSRHSEGNGLGLSIAKSFTELCGGEFDVKIDDDLFKVIIKLR